MVFTSNVIHNLIVDTIDDNDDGMIEAFHIRRQLVPPPPSQPMKGKGAIMKASPTTSCAPSPKPPHASSAHFVVVPTTNVGHEFLSDVPIL